MNNEIFERIIDEFNERIDKLEKIHDYSIHLGMIALLEKGLKISCREYELYPCEYENKFYVKFTSDNNIIEFDDSSKAVKFFMKENKRRLIESLKDGTSK